VSVGGIQMNLFFFTAADDDPVYRLKTEILITSGKKYGRDIHLFDIPKDQAWNRYKPKLINSLDLPGVDKYIYLDSDTVLTGPGDWESEECQGVADVLYYMKEDQRIKYTMSFIRNHTCNIGEGKGFEYVCEKWREMDLPVWCNSGVTVLPAEIHLSFTALWLEWMAKIDKHCEKGDIEGDEYPLMFARQEFDLPFLPPRFNGMCKSQPIYDWHVLLHADGNVTGEKRIPYDRAVKKIIEEQKI